MGLELSVAYREDGPHEGGADAKKMCLACTWPGVASPRVTAEQVMGEMTQGVSSASQKGDTFCVVEWSVEAVRSQRQERNGGKYREFKGAGFLILNSRKWKDPMEM